MAGVTQIETFKLGSVDVELVLERIRVYQQQHFKTAMSDITTDDRSRVGTNLNWGRVENLAIAYSLKKVKINGTNYAIAPQEPLRNFPDIEDYEYNAHIAAEILKRIVKVNPWLAKESPTDFIFSRYASEELLEEENPTMFQEDSSTSTS